MAIYELDPVDRIEVAAVGDPGQRRFFLLATGSGRSLTLGCEKSQVQALILRLHQMLETQQIEAPEDERPAASASPEPGDLFVLVASQAAVGESTEATEAVDAPSVRFWLSHDQVLAFSKQAESVLSAGRKLCPRCGLPMDASGHPCPVMNGARPIF